jgi:hypothetical protein
MRVCERVTGPLAVRRANLTMGMVDLAHDRRVVDGYDEQWLEKV